MLVVDYRCEGCDFNRRMSYLPRVCLLPDGRHVPMIQRHCWCAPAMASWCWKALIRTRMT